MFRASSRITVNSIARRNLSSSKGSSEGSVVNADASSTLNRLYHTGSLVLAGVTPIAFLLPSSPLSTPLDVALSLLIPYHSHVAMNYVVSDYVPKSARPAARAAVLITSIVAAAGLLKLTVHGPGVVETVKNIWSKPAKSS